jgi:hypothetical protein
MLTYKIEPVVNPARLQDILNDHAERGWRLVQVLPGCPVVDGYDCGFVLVLESGHGHRG